VPLDAWFDELGGLTPIEGNLHRSPLPYKEQHFRALRDAGIRVIYSMEEAIPAQRASTFDWRPHFWTDDAPPSPAQMDAFLADYLALPDDVSALVHCKAGWGRTGSAIACALVAKRGWSAERALSFYWSKVPPARDVMTWNGQAEFVRGYAASLKGRGLR